ncbi:MAG: hypothetical protein WAL47_01665, partial [Pyrinomonadaceae bacterium]
MPELPTYERELSSVHVEAILLAFTWRRTIAFKLKGKGILRRHVIAPSAARICWVSAVGLNSLERQPAALTNLKT